MLSQSPPGHGCKNNVGVKGKPGTSWGILLKLINCQPRQTADHSFRYCEKEEHKQLNKHINIYAPHSTISAVYIFSTGYIQSSKISLGRGQVVGRLRWYMHNSFLLLWAKYFSATLWSCLSRPVLTALYFMVSWCSIPSVPVLAWVTHSHSCWGCAYPCGVMWLPGCRCLSHIHLSRATSSSISMAVWCSVGFPTTVSFGPSFEGKSI